jgi:hypothetical protein
MKDKKVKIKISEKDLQKTILQNLKWYKDIYAFRNNSFFGSFTRPNGSKGFLQNNKKGAPDIILCVKGNWVGLELKSTDGKQSPDQKLAEQEINRAGGQYYIVRSISDFEKIINCIC